MIKLKKNGDKESVLSNYLIKEDIMDVKNELISYYLGDVPSKISLTLNYWGEKLWQTNY